MSANVDSEKIAKMFVDVGTMFVDVGTNCLGYGAITIKGAALPKQLAAEASAALSAALLGGIITPEEMALADHLLKKVLPAIPQVSLKYFVANKNFFSQLLHLIVKLFATIFCTSKNYFVFKNQNTGEIFRINKTALANGIINDLRRVLNTPQVVEVLPKLLSNAKFKEMIPSEAQTTAKIGEETAHIPDQHKPTELPELAPKAIAAVYAFMEAIKDSKKAPQYAASVELCLAPLKTLLTTIASSPQIPGGFKVVNEQEEAQYRPMPDSYSRPRVPTNQRPNVVVDGGERKRPAGHNHRRSYAG